MIGLFKSGIIFLLLCFVALFTGCFSVKSVSVGKVQDFKLEDFSLDEVSFSCKTNIKNPNNFKIKVVKVKLKASIENKTIGKLSKIKKIVIPAKSNQIYDIKASIKLSDNYSDFSSLTQISKNRSLLKFSGFIKVRMFIFGKKIPVEDKNLTKILNN